MEEKIKSFRFEHGKKTYRMAWLVEYCLFLIALSLAAFNIVFGIQEGDIVTGLLLAVGWAILAIIELSIIPMAGSFRLAKGINQVYSGCGLLGLLFLSAFTVYEFNEIASEYMTRGARKAAVTVEKIDNEIEKLQSEIKAVEDTSNDIKQSRAEYLETKEDALAAELLRYEQQKKKTEQYYAGLLEESSRNNEFPIYNPEEKKRLERIESLIDDQNKEIKSLRERKDEVIREGRLAQQQENAPRIELLQSQIQTIEKNILNVQADKDRRIKEAKGSIFSSKENKVEEIQTEARAVISQKQLNISSLETEIANLKAPSSQPHEALVIDSRIKEIQQLTQQQLSQKKEIEAAANRRMDTPEFKKIIEDNHNQINRVYQDRLNAATDDLEQHNSKVAEIEAKYNRDVASLESTSRSEAERYEERQKLESIISEHKTNINDIIEETSHQYERTMYFRMASWFSDESSTGFGKLPKKSDYNKALRYIFAPIGLFFGLTAVILAYLGTSFMFEESKKRDSSIDVEALQKRNDELEDKQKIFETTQQRLREAENSKKHAISIAVAELRSQLKETELQLTDQDRLRAQISDLKKKLDRNESDLVKAKQRVFEAIRAIPQSITILDQTKQGDESAT